MPGLAPLGTEHPLLVDRVQAVLRQAILDGKLQPGESLVESRLVSDLKVSKTPVREALVRLAESGLVTWTPHRGHTVTVLGANDVREIMRLRAALEGLAAREASSLLSAEDLDHLDALVDEAQQAASAGDAQRATDLGHAVHAAIHARCGNTRLLKAIHQIGDQFELVRRMSVRLPGRPEQSVEEHAEIARVMRTRDPDLAEAALRSHLLQIYEDMTAEAAPEPARPSVGIS